MILSDPKKMNTYIPTTLGSSLKLMWEWIELAEQEVIDKVIGDSVATKIEAMSDTSALRRNTERLICHLAYFNAIPNVDLIQTDNGFAVTGGQNSKTVPASKDRVASLRAQEEVFVEKLKGVVIRGITKQEDLRNIWKETIQSKTILRCFIWDYNRFCDLTGTLNNIEMWRNAVTAMPGIQDDAIIPMISRSYFSELVAKQIDQNATPADIAIMELISTAIVGFIVSKSQSSNDYRLAKSSIDRALGIMQTIPEDYPTYTSSPEATSIRSNVYNNKADDPTFMSCL